MQSRATSVTEYLAEAGPERRPALEQCRALIRRAAPQTRESMQSGMPTYEVGGSMLCAFASQKGYLAFYLCETPIVERYRASLGTRDCGKSCIRYRELASIPFPILEQMVSEAVAVARPTRASVPPSATRAGKGAVRRSAKRPAKAAGRKSATGAARRRRA